VGEVTDNPPRPLQGHEVPAEPLRPQCQPWVSNATLLTPSSGEAGHLLPKTVFLASYRDVEIVFDLDVSIFSGYVTWPPEPP